MEEHKHDHVAVVGARCEEEDGGGLEGNHRQQQHEDENTEEDCEHLHLRRRFHHRRDEQSGDGECGPKYNGGGGGPKGGNVPIPKPTIVACGYRHIRPRSGGTTTFPAWLVLLPVVPNKPIMTTLSTESSSSSSSSLPVSITSPSYSSSSTCCSYAYRWRSRRDFLILKRAVHSASAASTTSSSNDVLGDDGSRSSPSSRSSLPSYPKSAMAKLSDRAPWMRPDLDLPAADPDSKVVGIEEYRSVEGEAPVQKNNWAPLMKKSVFLVEDYLRSVHRLLCHLPTSSSTENTAQNESDDPPRECKASAGSSRECEAHDGTQSSPLGALADAWRVFCRDGDADGLLVGEFIGKDDGEGQRIGPGDGEEDADIVDEEKEADAIGRAASLGQYYASDKTVRQVVDRVVEIVGSSDRPLGDFTFVEPSCGDGRVMLGLADALLTTMSTKGTFSKDEGTARRRRGGGDDGCGRIVRCSIVGYDVDPAAVEVSRRNVSSFVKRRRRRQRQGHGDDDVGRTTGATTSTEGPSGDRGVVEGDCIEVVSDACRVYLAVRCRDFLSTTVDDVANDARWAPAGAASYGRSGKGGDEIGEVVVPDGSDGGRGGDLEDDRHSSSTTSSPPPPCLTAERDHGRVTVVFGGPPYSTGRGHGGGAGRGDGDGKITANIDREIPCDFVRHSLLRLGAYGVVFVLPERCRRDGDIGGLVEEVNAAIAGDCVPNGGPPVAPSAFSFSCTSEDLVDSTFDFRGRWVTQPSVLQTWRIRSDDAGGAAEETSR